MCIVHLKCELLVGSTAADFIFCSQVRPLTSPTQFLQLHGFCFQSLHLIQALVSMYCNLHNADEGLYQLEKLLYRRFHYY
jgi:hypothetical protein